MFLIISKPFNKITSMKYMYVTMRGNRKFFSLKMFQNQFLCCLMHFQASTASEGSKATLTMVWTLLSGLTQLGIAGLQNLYNKPPCLTFYSLLGPKLAMCDLQSVSDQLLKAVELPWRWFGPF